MSGVRHRAVAAACDLDKRDVLVELAVVRFALVVRKDEWVLLAVQVRRGDELDVAFEQSVPDHAQRREHGPAQHDRVDERRALDVLDDPRLAGLVEHVSDRLDEPGPGIGVAVPLRQVRVRLARRRGVDGVETHHPVPIEGQGVRLMELEWVVGLVVKINADDLEPCPGVADASAASAAEQVE